MLDNGHKLYDYIKNFRTNARCNIDFARTNKKN